MAYLSEKSGLSILEWPIYFEDRRIGQSKMSMPVKLEAAWRVFEIRLRYGGIGKHTRGSSSIVKRPDRWVLLLLLLLPACFLPR